MRPGEEARRRRLLQAMAAGGALAAADPALLIREALAQGVDQGIRRIRGSVTVNGREAKPGMPIQPGDVVATGRDAEALIVIGKDAFLQRRGSEIRFQQAATDFMRVVTGRILSVFGPGPKTILTETATVGIRGTGCYIECGGSQTYFCLCYGEADVVPTADPSKRESVSTRHHEKPMYIHGESGEKTIAPATVINHTDAELFMLEALVGRKPPFEPGQSAYPSAF